MKTEIDESLEGKLTQLCEMKTELRAKKNEFTYKTRHLRDSIKGLENIITAEVIQRGQTVTVGNIRAEFVPTVVIKMKKELTDEQ